MNLSQNSLSSNILVPLKSSSCFELSNGFSGLIFKNESNMLMSRVLPKRLGRVNNNTAD
ncbi:unknown [Succinatimonas sp. CAG:777]|nr:unknown [Succinatimonas sp. CAG:777]